MYTASGPEKLYRSALSGTREVPCPVRDAALACGSADASRHPLTGHKSAGPWRERVVIDLGIDLSITEATEANDASVIDQGHVVRALALRMTRTVLNATRAGQEDLSRRIHALFKVTHTHTHTHTHTLQIHTRVCVFGTALHPSLAHPLTLSSFLPCSRERRAPGQACAHSFLPLSRAQSKGQPAPHERSQQATL